MSNYKKGDLVQVFDGSYSLTIENGDFRHSYGVELTGRDFEVIDTDLILQSTDDGKFNTIILKAKDNDQIVYIQERMIKPVNRKTENVIYNITINVENDADINNIIEELKKLLSCGDNNCYIKI